MLGAGLPEDVPRPVGEGWQPVSLGDAGHDDPPMAELRRPGRLVRGGARVPERHVGQRDEPLRRHTRPLDEEVVVGADDVETETLVVDVGVVVPRHAEVAVQGGDRDPVLVHDLQPLRRVPGRRVDLRQPWELRERVLPAHGIVATLRVDDHGRRAEEPDPVVADEPGLQPRGLVVPDAGDVIAPLLGRHPTRPEVGWLRQVRISVDDRRHEFVRKCSRLSRMMSEPRPPRGGQELKY